MDPWLEQWLKDLWDHICELYKLWGGNCAELPPRPESKQLVAGMWGVFNTLGVPDLSEPGKRDRLIAVLSAIEKHLADKDNCLEPDVNQSLVDLILAIRKAANI